MPKNDWLNTFIEKNAWSIIAFIVIFVISYTTLSNKIEAQASRMDRIETTQQLLTENQRDIIILQQRQSQTEEVIREIKQDIKEIKALLNNR